MVKAHNLIPAKGGKRFIGTDRHAVGIAATGKSDLVCDISDAGACILSHAPFFDDHTAFALQLIGIKRYLICHVREDLKALFQVFGIIGGHFELIHSEVIAGHGIQTIGKTHADGGEVVHHFAFSKILGAIKGHVFSEVGQAELIVIFQHAARVHPETQFHAIGGFGVFDDVVFKTVFQSAMQDIRIGCQGHFCQLRRQLRAQDAERDEE